MHERSQIMDIVRGLAVMGMLLANVTFFASPLSIVLTRYWVKPADHVASMFVTFFLSGKVYSIFSLLFGLGCAMYMQRARETHEGLAFYVRRMAALFALGAVHVVLLSSADILHLYAVLGLMLLAVTRWSNRTLLIAAVVCLSLPTIIAVEESMRAARHAQQSASTADATAGYFAQVRLTVQTYRKGSFRDIVNLRLAEFRRRIGPVVIAAPHVLGMMLLGVYAYRRRVFENVPGHRRLLWRVIAVTLPIGLILNGLVTWASVTTSVDPSSAMISLLADASFLAGATAFALLYTASAALWLVPRTHSLLAVSLAAVGRLALSNYVAQSVICTTIFLGYGLGLYGRYGPGTVVPMAIVIGLVLTMLSVWWTRRFEYGPLEWLWRSFSYARLQPFRVRPTVTV
jgi:uncharacterized protein